MTWMLEQGEWRATAEGDGRTGFHLSSLYSPVGWFSWTDAAAMYEQAQRAPDLMKGLINTVLGLPFEEEAEASEWQRLDDRRENYKIGAVPMPGLFLTAGIDVQKDRLEVEVFAWGGDKESWSVDYSVLDGDTARPEIWDRLDELLRRDWKHESGHRLQIRVMCVDAGLCDPGCLWLGAATSAGELGTNRRSRSAAAHGCGDQGQRSRYRAAAFGVESRCRRQTPRSPCVVAGHDA